MRLNQCRRLSLLIPGQKIECLIVRPGGNNGHHISDNYHVIRGHQSVYYGRISSQILRKCLRMTQHRRVVGLTSKNVIRDPGQTPPGLAYPQLPGIRYPATLYPVSQARCSHIRKEKLFDSLRLYDIIVQP